MGSSPSKRKLSNFSIKDALPVRFNNNNFHESNPNGTVKPADRREEHQKVLIKQPQQAENLPSNPQDERGTGPSTLEPITTTRSQNDFIKKSDSSPKCLQASYRPCLLLKITVLRGHNITLGSFDDFLDTPDPYVKLLIPTSPNGKRRTKVQRNTNNPVWDEAFYFYLDAEQLNLLQITLMESDILSDDFVETETFDLGTLEINKTSAKTFKFREASTVDVEMKVENCTAPTDMRYTTDLCKEEKKFIMRRKEYVFEAMGSFLGDRRPQTIEEVPNVAILGSGGGFRAMVSLSGVFCALKDMGVLDCAMYATGLSGSAWYLSTLYSHPEWPHVHPRVVRDALRENIDDNWMWLMVTPSWMYKHLKIIMDKKRRGQPVSFTDFFGYLVGDTILKDHDEMPLLSEQQKKIEDALVPFPLYCCVHVKHNIPAKEYCEWLEFSPYEIGIPRYGTFMKTEFFGSKFFCGKLVAAYPEPPLHYLQGIWGSAFTVLLQRVLRERKLPSDTVDEMSNMGDLRDELREAIDGKDDDDDAEDSDSDNEDDNDVTDGYNNNNNNNDETKEKHDDDNDEGFFGRFFEALVDRLAVFKTRAGRAGLVHNFLRGLQVMTTAPLFSGEAEEEVETADESALTSSRIYLVDSGLVFNSPYPPLLRPERGVDVFLSFDFSVRKRDVEFPFEELLLAEQWARKNKLKFPPIEAELQYKTHGMKEFYVFQDPEDPTCPIVIHFMLANRTFKEQLKPGVLRETTEEKNYADFSLFEDKHNWYSTFNFHYRNEQFNRLADLNEFNTLLGEQTIKDVIAGCIQRRRQRRAHLSHWLSDL